VAIIHDLEQDVYDDIPGPVFVRGYLKKYASLLDLDANDLPPLPQAEPLKALAPPAPPLGARRNEIRSNHILVRSITWLIILSIIGLLRTWWNNKIAPDGGRVEMLAPSNIENYSDPTQLIPNPPQLNTTAPNMIPTPAAVEPGLELRSQNADEKIDTNTKKPSGTVSPIPTAPNSEPPPTYSPPPIQLPNPNGPIPQIEKTTEAIVQDKPTSGSIAPPKSTVEPPALPPAVPATPPVIELKIFKTCWIKIIDSEGKFRIIGNLKRGDNKILEGSPPYDIVIGNIGAAKLTIDGKPINLRTRSRGGVAHFKFDPANTPN
ncbi:hypothetical protein TI04_06905, partial [Achromatium sp. WMS2]